MPPSGDNDLTTEDMAAASRGAVARSRRGSTTPGFAVAAGHELTAQAAADVLRDGGNVIDAVIAGALMAMVAEPVLAGMLGGGFLMTRSPGGGTYTEDFFVRTPGRRISEEDLDLRSVHADFGSTTQEFHIGAGSIAVPCLARTLGELHSNRGRMPISQVAQPAIRAAIDGVQVTGFQARLLQIVAPIYQATDSARDLFCSDGRLLAEGEIYRNPDLGDVLDVFACDGDDFITKGEVAQALTEVTREGGHLTMDDLRRHHPQGRTTLKLRRGQGEIALNPPPSLGGALVAFTLSVLDREPDAATVVRGLEATTRARIEAALDDDSTCGAQQLLSPDMLARYRNEIRAHAAATRGTTHISVVDDEGNGAAMTLSNGEGAGMILQGTGIMPNNMLGEADLLPNGLFSWQPDQRMSSMMCPMTINWPDGRFTMLGSGGSNRIRSALAQVALNLIDRDMPLDDAINAPRRHVEAGDPPAVDFEDIGGEAMRDTILAAYPDARPWPDRSMFFGGVHAAMSGPRGMAAAGDPRRAGSSFVG